jgi:hypothetical protein
VFVAGQHWLADAVVLEQDGCFARVFTGNDIDALEYFKSANSDITEIADWC